MVKARNTPRKKKSCVSDEGSMPPPTPPGAAPQELKELLAKVAELAGEVARLKEAGGERGSAQKPFEAAGGQSTVQRTTAEPIPCADDGVGAERASGAGHSTTEHHVGTTPGAVGTATGLGEGKQEDFPGGYLTSGSEGEQESEAEPPTHGLAALDPEKWGRLSEERRPVLVGGIDVRYAQLLGHARAGRTYGREIQHLVAVLKVLASSIGIGGPVAQDRAMTDIAKRTLVRLEALQLGVTGGEWAAADALQDSFENENDIPKFLRKGHKAARKTSKRHAGGKKIFRPQHQSQKAPPTRRPRNHKKGGHVRWRRP
eukprot:TRINITY_DN4999_c0_g2_i1.p1 TRINITY_DN4999_c0_g2~~TRINITY_DN4999_c0_g2_i1.p1  ORF type:complete len:337 (+),score=32.92 TRINITY_DN4999_c0_g2_i1:67-1011(+)